MQTLSISQQLILEAFDKGYTIKDNGTVFNKNNKEVGRLGSNGYRIITFRKNKVPVKVLIHRMQAFKKYGYEMFKEGILVRHLNGVPTDNSYDNIAIGTASDNMMDIPVSVRRKKSSKANNVHNHIDIIKDRKNGMTYAELMSKYNISSKGTISFIINKSMVNEPLPAT